MLCAKNMNIIQRSDIVNGIIFPFHFVLTVPSMMYAHVNPLPLILFPTSNSFFGHNNYTAVLYNPLICEEREAGRKGM